MQEDHSHNSRPNRRSDTRRSAPRTYRAEVHFVGTPAHLFTIKDMSSEGACILIGKNSSVLKYIKVDQIVDVDFLSKDPSYPSGRFRSIIRHISTTQEARYRNHWLVGISILEKLEPNRSFKWSSSV
jgi:hypothetical protein